MVTITKSRRRQRRYSVTQERTACVEFEYPSPNGQHYRLNVPNLSSSGVSFSIEGHDELMALEPGVNLPGATVRVGDCMIRGEMVIMHTTPQPGAGLLCGALLYPATDEDLVKLKSVIAGMEAVGTD